MLGNWALMPSQQGVEAWVPFFRTRDRRETAPWWLLRAICELQLEIKGKVLLFLNMVRRNLRALPGAWAGFPVTFSPHTLHSSSPASGAADRSRMRPAIPSLITEVFPIARTSGAFTICRALFVEITFHSLQTRKARERLGTVNIDGAYAHKQLSAYFTSFSL